MILVLENQKGLKMEKDMMGNNQKVEKKSSNITIRLDNVLFDEYKSLCQKNGYDISKRLRLFIEQEIEFEKRGLNLFNKLGN
jgi:hypothetical protein